MTPLSAIAGKIVILLKNWTIDELRDFVIKGLNYQSFHYLIKQK